MLRNAKYSLLTALVGLSLASCGGSLPGSDKLPGGGLPGGDVDANACGGMNFNAGVKKLRGFVEAVLTLQDAAAATERDLLKGCQAMATELGVSTEGDLATVCNAAKTALQEHIQVGLKAGAKLELVAEPPRCEVNIDAAASAAASCEGSASADVGVECGGTCEGKCNGTCEGSTGEGGQCDGVCKGKCEGSCNGHADVNASASCEAQAEVKANVDAKCTEPKVEVKFEAGMVVDKSKLAKAEAAIKAGMPAILRLKARIKMIGRAAAGTVKAGAALVESIGDFKSAMEKQAVCITGQIKGAVDLVGKVAGSFEVQAEVSVSVSASASVEGGAGG